MTKVNFYLLKQNSVAAAQALCCKLAEQQARQGRRVFVLADSAETAQELDHLMWSFTPDSFVPHALASDAAAASAAITIGHEVAQATAATCVLNLGNGTLAAHEGLAAIAEFILNDDESKAESRVRWNRYKQLGYELQLHQL